jgi:hypothetical protein
MDTTFSIFIILGVLMIGIIVIAFFNMAARQKVIEWANGNRYEIISIRSCFVYCGPFGLVMRGYYVYYITVKTHQGRIREGWVRYTAMTGLLFRLLPKRKQHRIEVRWKT